MHDPNVVDRIRKRYASFAAHEARGVSPLYEALAEAVVRHDDLVQFILSLPERKRQPNLILAAVRHVCGLPDGPEHFIQLVRQHQTHIESVVLARNT